MPQWIQRLPVLLGMGLLVCPWLIPVVNWIGQTAGQPAPLIQEGALHGVENPLEPPVYASDALWSHQFREAFAAEFDHDLPMLTWAVEFKNQLYYWLLHQSGIDTVVIGKHRQLLEPGYVDEYCFREPQVILRHADEWAAQLAQIQAWYAAEGKVFVYVITPSKVATYPQYIPALQPCPAPPTARDALGPLWDATLDRHGVRYVDAAALTRAAAPNFPFEMFPLGGTHWNEVAATMATQAVIDSINQAPTPWKLQPFTFTWTMAPPVGISRDLTDLLNVPYPRLDWKAPQTQVAPIPPAWGCAPTDLAVVGGSFTYEILWTLDKLPCPPTVRFYSYFVANQAIYPGDIRGPVVSDERDRKLIAESKIVILEENEVLTLRSNHGPLLYDLLAAHKAMLEADHPPKR
ncbi:alginate O-acetyltransferase AlgX-related protein [Acidisphaera sp. L21]|uniref:alginate O-acetyltransferase AlgX-related protein n=1 Tax=Acidisphaera sp. L21 TaxID=1641851 RepID=UPI00131D8988|nr:hypothetical protein [Acidisphaera sp. L21]